MQELNQRLSQWLSLAEWWYNNSHHTIIKMSHFEVLYGYAPSPLLSYVLGTSKNESIDQTLRTRDKNIIILKENLSAAQNHMKFYADKRRFERQFEVGDWVYLLLQPYRQMSFIARHNIKLFSWFYGPYQVLKRVGIVAY